MVKEEVASDIGFMLYMAGQREGNNMKKLYNKYKSFLPEHWRIKNEKLYGSGKTQKSNG